MVSYTRPGVCAFMLVCFTFEAKPGKEAEFERLLNNPQSAKKIAGLMGASRNSLFIKGGRMVRIFEFPEGKEPVSLGELANTDKGIESFLRALGPLVKEGFDIKVPGSLDAFNARVALPLAYDVRP
jgi:hypothetical protein